MTDLFVEAEDDILSPRGFVADESLLVVGATGPTDVEPPASWARCRGR